LDVVYCHLSKPTTSVAQLWRVTYNSGGSMADTPQPPGVARAGQLLRNLLTSRTAYRRRWQQHARRMRQAEVSYAGVSQVVALYLWDQGLKPDTDTDLPRRLRDRVSRALQGEQLTYETLTWITEAFDFNAADSHDVWCAFSGSGHPEDGITFTLSNPRVPIIKPQRHRCDSVVPTLSHRY